MPAWTSGPGDGNACRSFARSTVGITASAGGPDPPGLPQPAKQSAAITENSHTKRDARTAVPMGEIGSFTAPSQMFLMQNLFFCGPGYCATDRATKICRKPGRVKQEIIPRPE